jgi:hypothetical protein
VVSEADFDSAEKTDRRPPEEGGHDRMTFSLDKRTRRYLASIPEKQRSEAVEDGIYLLSLLNDIIEREGIKPTREGRRRRLAKIGRV